MTPEIDVNSIQPAKEAFLAADQHGHRHDLLCAARLLDGTKVLICLLPEHKSWVDRRIATQLLTYAIRVHGDRVRDEPLSQRDKVAVGADSRESVPDMRSWCLSRRWRFLNFCRTGKKTTPGWRH
ncbi:MAG: Rpn family recombination-promoting nuclease/putative transposase [Planctomyces sp.]